MNRIVISTLAQVFLIAAVAADDAPVLTVGIGQSEEFHFDGKPSTGYRWFLDEDASTGLGVVDVETLGYGETYTRLLGASAPYRFRIGCEREGRAELVFDYVSPGGASVAETRMLHIVCE